MKEWETASLQASAFLLVCTTKKQQSTAEMRVSQTCGFICFFTYSCSQTNLVAGETGEP